MDFVRAALRAMRGGLLALLSSSGVVGATLGLNNIWAAAVLGVTGFVASAVPLYINWMRDSAIGAGAAENALPVREYAWEAQALVGGAWHRRSEQKRPVDAGTVSTRHNGHADKVRNKRPVVGRFSRAGPPPPALHRDLSAVVPILIPLFRTLLQLNSWNDELAAGLILLTHVG